MVAGRFLLQRLEDDRLEVAAPLGPDRGEAMRRDLADDARNVEDRRRVQVIGQPARDKLVQDDPEGVDVAPHVDRVDVSAALFGAHVPQRSDDLARRRLEGCDREIRVRGSGDRSRILRH